MNFFIVLYTVLAITNPSVCPSDRLSVIKFADDCTLLVPDVSAENELSNIIAWRVVNKLGLKNSCASYCSLVKNRDGGGIF